MSPNDAGRNKEDVRRFAEQLALLLAESGLARMPARAFAYVVADDAETHTAAELARGMRVSPAAISGAVRMLVEIGILIKERHPGARVDHYRIYGDDVWATLVERQLPFFDQSERVFTAGLRLLDPNRRGGRRIHETRDFYRFLSAEMMELTRRWRERRRAVTDSVTSAPAPVAAGPAG